MGMRKVCHTDAAAISCACGVTMQRLESLLFQSDRPVRIHLLLLLLLPIGAAQSTTVQTWSGASFISRNSAEVGVADFDKDGHVDIAISASEQRWYAGPDYSTWYQIGQSDGGPYAAQVADINGDGWPDFVTSDGQRNAPDSANGEAGELYVYLNPGATGDPKQLWQRVTVYSGNVYHQNDLRVADMDGDGRLDIIERTWSSERVVVALQNANINNWTVRVFDTEETGKPEGISAGDIDGDDENEIVLSGVYWDNPGGWRSGDPIEHLIDSQFQGSTYGKVKSAVGDIDGDGDNDIYMASAEGADRYLAWYENNGPNTSGGVQLQRHIIKNNTGKFHMVQLVDVDRDGDLDVATGRSFGSKGVYIFYNTTTPDGVTWTEQNFDTNGEIYTGVVADLDGDSDLDVVGPSKFYGGNVRIYKNESPGEPLVVTPDSLDFSAVGGSQTVAVSTNDNWNGIPDQNWISVNPAMGFGNANVSVTAQAHSGFGPRFATVTFANSERLQTISIAQQGLPDNTPPSTPVIQSVSNVTSNSFSMTWSGSADNSGAIKEYIVYVNSVEHQRTPNTTISVGGLNAVTNYSIQVAAIDFSGNESSRSVAINVTTAQAPPSPQPVYYWKLDETAGNSTNEAINGLPYQLENISGNEWLTGVLNGALNFDGNNDDDDYIDLGSLDAPVSSVTFSAWINPDDLDGAGEGRILAKSTGISESDHYWMLSTIKSGSVFVPRVRLRANGSVTTLIGNSEQHVRENQWQHIAATYDGSILRLFLNGVQVGTVSKSGTVDQNANVLAAIGNTPSGDTAGRAFSGRIDDVCIFDQALSATNIQNIYNNGSAALCDNFGSSPADTTPPELEEATAVSTPTTDNTPSFTLGSSEAGTASFYGGCENSTNRAVDAGPPSPAPG